MSKKNIGSTIGVLAAVTIGASAYASTINNLDKEDQSKKVLENNVSYIEKEYASKVNSVKKDYSNEVSNTKFAEKTETKKDAKLSKTRNLADPTLFESSSEDAIVKAIDEKIQENKEEDQNQNTVEQVIEQSPVVQKFVAVESLNVRSSKNDQENNVIDVLNKNTKVSGQVEDGWLKTDKGYIKLDFLSDQAVEDTNQEDILAQEEARKAEEAKKAEEARKAEEAKKAEEARKAEEAKKAEEARKAEEAKKAEEARKAEEAKKAQASQATSYTGWVNVSALNVRSGAGTGSSIVGSLSTGDKVSGTLQNGWLKISYNGQVAYISANYLSNREVKKPVVEKKQENNTPAKQENTVQSQAYTGWVNTAALNVRSGASTSYSIIGSYTMGDKVSGQLANGWLKVNYNGRSGYISANLLSSKEVAKPQQVVENNRTNNNQTAQQTSAQRPQASASGQAAANIARQFVGYPYVWGGTSPSGFDCSGLVYYAYKQIGVNLNRNSAAQFSNGYSVGINNLKPGDLVFFNQSGSIDHVGMIVDYNGNYVHAVSPGVGVQIGNIYNSWSQRVFAGARRIF
ncbi:NlpC/P60 family protein [Anaerococcus sp.]|uniref:C40 family peptidase n=1 Tax=Anaerococcus sp. TaxID=1872515 RepID=UPI002A913F99|nr:NlpC/P60 family protein [Anaerococcus sp.]MDY6127570.1 NlpC/P60 family protein [Anaerococcus sp.]